jgi:glycosyltransferase involved in cell wall biosynthesis
MKRIFFDVTILHYGDDLRGIAQVILQLVRLFRDDARFREIHFIATQKVFLQNLAPLEIPAGRVAIVKPPPLFLNSWRFHGALTKWRYRKLLPHAGFVLHAEYRTALAANIPQLVIFYDFIFLEGERIGRKKMLLRSLGRALYLNYLMKKLSVASLVPYKITISEYTRSELLRRFPACDPRSATTLPIGFRKNLGCGTWVDKGDFGDTIQYLCVGGILEVRKNIMALLQNFGSFPHPGTAKLHLAGALSVHEKKVLVKNLQALGLEGRVVIHGLVDDAALQSLYRQAHFFLFPSLMEGFGLPVIEAMAGGVVACAFRNSSMPEIVGDCAILKENNDFSGWAMEIRKLIDRPESYNELRRKSIDCAMRFSEQNMFKRYGDYLESLLCVKDGRSLPGS